MDSSSVLHYFENNMHLIYFPGGGEVFQNFKVIQSSVNSQNGCHKNFLELMLRIHVSPGTSLRILINCSTIVNHPAARYSKHVRASTVLRVFSDGPRFIENSEYFLHGFMDFCINRTASSSPLGKTATLFSSRGIANTPQDRRKILRMVVQAHSLPQK